MTEERQERLEILESKPEVAAKITFSAIALAVAMLLLFTWIADEVAHSATMRFDIAVREFVHRFASPAVTTLMQAFSVIGGQVLVALSVVIPLVLWWKKKRRAAIWLVTTMLGALVLDLALKYGFHRHRPVPYFGKVPLTYSFPSGHSLFSFCFYGALAGLLAARTDSKIQKIAIHGCAALLIFFVGLSRVYLGVHYPTDVLAGYLAAGVWVSAVVMLDRYRARRKARA